MSEKPRITKRGFCPYGARVWICISKDGFGQGESPALAFDAWKRYVNFYAPKHDSTNTR